MLQFGIPKPKRAGRPHSRVPKGISWSCPLPVLGGSLDALDVRLFRDLLQSPASSPMGAHFRMSFGSIAKKVGVDEETVRHRIRRFHQDGLISGWRTIMNPAILGGGLYGIIFDVNPAIRKDEVIEAARLIPGMFLIVSFHGSLMTAVLRSYNDSAMRKHIEILRRLSKADRIYVAKVPFPPCRIDLSKSDWDVLRALRGDPRKPYSTVSRELGLSSRTVKRRLERMIHEGAVFAFPAVDPNAARGVVMAALIVTYDPERKAHLDPQIFAKLETYLWHVFHMLPSEIDGLQSTTFNLALPTVGRSTEILRWAQSLPGLVGARIGLYEVAETLFEVFDEEIGKRVAGLS